MERNDPAENEMEYIQPTCALRRLRKAQAGQSVYIFAPTGFGKTELVRRYLSGQPYDYLSCLRFPWDEIQAAEGERRTVVVDDLYALRDETLRRRVLDLAKRPDVWLILINRSAIPPWLMPLHVSRGMLIIGEEDLRLGDREVAEYLAGCGVSCTAEEVRLLNERAGGNAYLLRHAALRLKEGASVGEELFAEVRDAFADYLDANLISRWDSELVEFLMEMSVVDEFTLDLAEMITGNPRSASMLARAEETGSFLWRTGNTYRLRPSLLLALRRRAERVCGREQLRDCAYNAGLYYEMRDETVTALRLYEQAGRSNRVKDLLIRNARCNPGNGHYYELRRYYLAMDEEEIARSPILMAAMSMLCSMLMDDERSEYWYGKLKSFAASAKGGERREALSRLAYLAIGLPHRGSLDMVEIMKGVAAALVDKGISLPEFSVTSNMPSTMNGGKDFCHWSPSDQALAVSLGPVVERLLGRYGKGMVKAALGESLYEKGHDTYAVLSLLTRAQMEAEQGGKAEIAFAAVGVRVRLSLICDSFQGASELLGSFERSVREQQAVQLLPNIAALRCRLALYAGDLAAVGEWMETAPDEDCAFFSLDRYRYLTKVRCYIARGSYLQALALLEKLRYYAERWQRTYILMETAMLRSIVKERMGGPWQEELTGMLRRASGYGFLRIISEEGGAVLPLLQKVRAACERDPEIDQKWLRRLMDDTQAMAGRYPRYLKKLNAAASDFGETALAVLRLQAQGMKAREVAAMLSITVDTVKYHTRENYRKLGASNRTDAILAARGLGIL